MAAEISGLVPLDLSRFFKAHPTLETERLRLRPLTLGDVEAVYGYCSDPVVTQFRIRPTHRSRQETVEYIHAMQDDYTKGRRLPWGIVVKDSHQLIGNCDFHHIHPEYHRSEIGFVLHRSHWGHGYMSEAVREMIRFAFEEMRLHRVEACCDVHNVRSAKVLERCGLAREGILRDLESRKGEFATIKAYAIINSGGM